MTEQLKAEAYVRSQRPALMRLSFGCDVIVAGIREDNPGCENDVVVDSRKDEHGRIGLGYFGHVHPDDLTIIGHRPQLQDWLAALGQLEDGDPFCVDCWGNLEDINRIGELLMQFNQTTGQPATEADYKTYNDLVGI